MRFSIVIPTYTRSDKLRECLNSIVEFTDLAETEIVVVANGASDETRQVCSEYPVTLLWFNEPLGYPKACNHGIRASSGEYVVLLNDDTQLLPQPKNEWMDVLVGPMLADESIGLTGPLQEHDPNSNHDFLIFFCVMIRRKVFESIGLLDESFLYFGEDTAFCIEAERAGWKVVRVPEDSPTTLATLDPDTTLEAWKHDRIHTGNFRIFHDAESTIGYLPDSENVLRQSRAILQERYGKETKVNTPTGVCAKCKNPLVDGTCVGEEGKLNCNGLYIWRAAQVDGWFGVDEGAWLAKQVKSLPVGAKVLEIGSWHGRSSRFIADNLPEDGQVWCCDTFNGSSGEPEMHGTAHWERGDHAFQWWWCNLQEHIVNGRVVPVRMHSASAAHTFAHLIEKGQMEQFDLIFIDGDHSEEGIKTDVEAWLPLLKDGGLMCGHDYYKESEGPYWVHVRQYVENKFSNVEKAATSIWHVRPHEKKNPEAVETKRRVFDAFIYNGEEDVLEIRLATLNDVVDRFVICEGTLTHSGNPKPLHFDLNKARFEKYLHKISHVVVDDYPEVSGSIYDQAWARERHQRDSVMLGLQDCKPDDIVLIGDADEIASPEVIKNYDPSQGLCRLKQRLFYYYLNCENKEGWDWQKIAPYKVVKELTPCGVRYPPAGDMPLIENGGWHFSFLGNAKSAIKKVSDYAHREYDTPELMNPERVSQLIEEGRDIFGRDLKYELVAIDKNYPQYVKDRVAGLSDSGLIKTANRGRTVTAEVSTKDRYFTTLPLTISAIANQTRKVDKLVIYDDGEQLDLRTISPFDGLLKMLDELKIKWEVIRTPRQGQVSNHQHCLETADTTFIWRVDDDEIPAPNCLEVLIGAIQDYETEEQDSIGAVAGLVHHPGAVSPLPEFVDGTLKDVQAGLNMQWFDFNSRPREVEHLYSTFLYRVEAGRKAGGYPKGLSTVGHREETIFSHSIKRSGYKLIVTPFARTWHLREPSGGIRSFTDHSLWEHDEKVFQSYLNEWGVGGRPTKLIVLDAGIGDHFAFLSILPKVREAHPDKDLALAVCYPSVFDGEDLKLISIADAKNMLGDRYDDYSIYKYLWDKDWKGSLADGMLAMHG